MINIATTDMFSWLSRAKKGRAFITPSQKISGNRKVKGNILERSYLQRDCWSITCYLIKNDLHHGKFKIFCKQLHFKTTAGEYV